MSNERLPRDWPLHPAETAVLVVDAQASETTPETLAKYPDYGTIQRDRAFPALKRLVTGARAAGCEIVYTVIEALTHDGRERSLDHKLSGILVPKGSPLARMVPEAGQTADDIVLRKTSSGVFNSTNAAYVLRNLGIRQVVVAGLRTDQCIDMAIRDGADHGFYMVCAADACASVTEAEHEAALKAFGGYCRVQSVDAILTDLAEGAHHREPLPHV